MAFDVHIHIAENSHRGRVIQSIANEQQLTPEQVVEQILDDGIRTREKPTTKLENGKSPAEMLIGLFSKPEDAALIDEVTAIAYEGRKAAATKLSH